MSRKFCDCILRIYQWLFLIDNIIKRIFCENKINLFYIKKQPIKLKATCCFISKNYLMCLNDIFSHFYAQNKNASLQPKQSVKSCLTFIFENGDKLNSNITVINYEHGWMFLANSLISNVFSKQRYQVDVDSLYMHHVLKIKVYFAMDKNGGLRLTSSKVYNRFIFRGVIVYP